MRRRKPPENKGGAPGWMTTYGDMVTLLLTFFVMLYASSTIDTQKYIQIVNSLRGALGGNVGVLNNGASVQNIGDKTTENLVYRRLLEQLTRVVSQRGLEGKVEISTTDEGIVLSFKERLFFRIGSADILIEAYSILNEVGTILKEHELPIRVEGHTCDLPIKNYKFPSNWELSAIRAINVVRYLIENSKIKPELISSAAYGQYRPIVENHNEENRARNRRVDIIIIVAPRLLLESK